MCIIVQSCDQLRVHVKYVSVHVKYVSVRVVYVSVVSTWCMYVCVTPCLTVPLL